jgi:hypothetical protein
MRHANAPQEWTEGHYGCYSIGAQSASLARVSSFEELWVKGTVAITTGIEA